MVNHLEEDGAEAEAAVQMDLDAELDDLVFEDELSSNIGSSVTVIEAKRGPEEAAGRMPLLRRLFARHTRPGEASGSGGGSRRGHGLRASGKKGLWHPLLLFTVH